MQITCLLNRKQSQRVLVFYVDSIVRYDRIGLRLVLGDLASPALLPLSSQLVAEELRADKEAVITMNGSF